MKKTKKPKYKQRANIQKTLGTASIAAGGVGGFLGYQFYNGWEDFTEGMENFIVVQENSMKLNIFLALPIFLSFLITFIVFKKKNKDLFNNKISINLFIATVITFIIYSIIGITFFTLLGLLGGSIIEETTFAPLAKRNVRRAEIQGEYDAEYEKEKVRIKARKEAGDYSGAV